MLKEKRFEADDGFVHVVHNAHVSVAAGRVVQRIEEIYYYGDADAVQNSGTDTMGWNSSREDIRFLEAVVLRADGGTSQFDPDTVNVVDTDSYDVFTDYRDVVLQLSGIEPGSLSVLSYSSARTSV